MVSLTAGGDILNQAGGRISGGTVIASAARDIIAQGGSSISGGNILLSAGRDISLTASTSSTSTSERKDLGKGRFTQSSSTTQTVTGAEIAATGNLVVSAGRDLTLTAAKVSAGGDASLSAGRDVTITGVTTTDTTAASARTGKKNSTSSATSTQTFNGTTLTSGGNLSVAAGNTLTVKGSDIAAGGNATLTGTNGVSITSALENSSADSSTKTKRKSATTSETASTNRLTSITAGGNLGVGSTAGALTIAGADLSATGTTTLVGQNVTVSGVIDSATFDATSRTVKKGLLSKKVTTTTNSSASQAVVASTVSGDRVNVVATGGDVTVRGSIIVSDNGTVVQATNNITIDTLEARSSQSQSVKVKKSGLSISGAGLFAGVAKSTNASTLETTTNTGSLVGSANGDVTVNAGKALTITGSQVAAPGTLNLIGESVKIENATDTANSTSLSKSSSFGVSIKAYENVSGAVKSVSTLADRVGQGAKGGAAATGITAASEKLRTVAAVTNALTNTAGVTASIGFSKSKSTTATQEQAVVGSTIAGGTVNVTATGTDVRVIGSSITSTGDTNLNAARDVILESAANQIDSQFKSKSAGASLGVTVGVAVVGGVTASASVGVNASKSSGTSTETTQVGSTVTAGGTLSLTTGRDAILKGAVAQGQNVVATIGRDLSVESVQDTSSRSSTSAGFSAGLTLAPGAGLGGNGGVNVGKGSGSSSIVSEQTALIAREGSLSATVKGNTDIKGGVIAALDADGKDSGKLTLTTGTLTASDIKDSAKSKDVSVGLSASINNVTDKNTRSANLPVVDGSFASSSFKQDTKATMGQGTLNVGVPTENGTINRDVDASQVVTKDKQTGFTVYADVAAAKELVSLVKGDKENSVILQGAKALVNDPLRIAKDVVAEVKANTDKTPFNSQLEQLTATVGLIIGALDEKGIARKLANAPLPKEAEASIAALETIADQPSKQAELARAAGDTKGAAKARAAEDEALEAAELIRSPQFTEANASAIKGRLLNIANPGAIATTRTKSTDGSGNATSALVVNPSGGGIATGPEGGTPPVPGAGGPKPGEIIIVTVNLAREESTVGRVVVDGLSFAKTKLDSLSSLIKDIATTGVRAVLTGGTGPLISIAVNQGAGKALEFVPQSLLRPIAEAGAKLDKFVGDGGSSFLLSKEFTAVTNDNSSGTRSDSSATTFGVTTLFGVSLAPIVNKAKALFKADKGGAPDVVPPIDRSKISTAKPGQSAVPRDLNEQVLFNRVKADPAGGRDINGANNDPRFLEADGFQKKSAVQILPDGKSFDVHYQYNKKTGEIFDVKIVTPRRIPPVLQPGPSIKGK